MLLSGCRTIFRSPLWGQDGVDDVIGADSFEAGLQVFLIQPHHPSLLHPGRRRRQDERRVGGLRTNQTHKQCFVESTCSHLLCQDKHLSTGSHMLSFVSFNCVTPLFLHPPPAWQWIFFRGEREIEKKYSPINAEIWNPSAPVHRSVSKQMAGRKTNRSWVAAVI